MTSIRSIRKRGQRRMAQMVVDRAALRDIIQRMEYLVDIAHTLKGVLDNPMREGWDD